MREKKRRQISGGLLLKFLLNHLVIVLDNLCGIKTRLQHSICISNNTIIELFLDFNFGTSLEVYNKEQLTNE